MSNSDLTFINNLLIDNIDNFIKLTIKDKNYSFKPVDFIITAHSQAYTLVGKDAIYDT